MPWSTKAIAPLLIGLSWMGVRVESQVDTHELLQILRIHTWRIRVPTAADEVWTVAGVSDRQLHSTGKKPAGLTPIPKELFAFRELGNDKLEFTFSDWKRATHGTEDLCRLGTDCSQRYELLWNDEPSYSADGEQCVLGQIAYPAKREKLFLILVRTNRSSP
jgi:hypothetical protein